MAAYICIDLKSFYASAECVERGLDPLNVNLVVADESRTEKTICLAVSPALKAIGVPGRPRLFEVVQKVEEENRRRRERAPYHTFRGNSYYADELVKNPSLALSYVIAPPQMKRYMEVSAGIYDIYLRYIAPEDIHVYSIDEVFIDATGYLDTYHCTARELKLVGLFGRKGRILKNVYLPKDDGGTSEIDLLYITQKGIFVIESKNYSGWIFGNSKEQYWTQSLPDGTKNRFYNPIKQNQTHLKWLRQFLSRDLPLFSSIVFSERCELKKVTFDEPNVDVMNRDELYAAVREVWEREPDVLTDEEVGQIYTTLEPLTDVDAAEAKLHFTDGTSVRISQICRIRTGG